MIRNTVILLLASALLAACSSAPKPKTLNGRHRQPVNVGAVPPVAAPSSALLPHAVQTIPRAVCAPCSYPGATTLPEITDAPQNTSQELARMYRFEFPFGGIALAVPLEIGAEMMELAKAARSIHIRGRTDGPTYSAGDETVALKRAIAARDYLAKHGIAPARIQLDYVSGGDYLADNTTSEGQSRNRRVEIEFDFGDSEPAAEVAAR